MQFGPATDQVFRWCEVVVLIQLRIPAPNRNYSFLFFDGEIFGVMGKTHLTKLQLLHFGILKTPDLLAVLDIPKHNRFAGAEGGGHDALRGRYGNPQHVLTRNTRMYRGDEAFLVVNKLRAPSKGERPRKNVSGIHHAVPPKGSRYSHGISSFLQGNVRLRNLMAPVSIAPLVHGPPHIKREPAMSGPDDRCAILVGCVKR